jgi:DUF1365 family protein
MKWLMNGEVFHQRHFPRPNRFRYRVFYLRFPLEEMARLKSRFFSVDRFNLFSFHQKDHSGYRKGDRESSLNWGREQFLSRGIDPASITLQTFPRVLGRVFNPVSFWYAADGEGEWVAVLAEVNNTFGGRHHYMIEKGGEPIRSGESFLVDKALHVSPFNEIEGVYDFRFEWQDREIDRVRIRYLVDGRLKLYTQIQGRAMELDGTNLLRMGLAIPFQTLKVLFLIHFQALVLFFKGVPFVGSRSRLEKTKESTGDE